MKNTKIELSEEAKQKRAEYQRNWRRKNPDRLRKYQASYWEKQAQSGSRMMDVHESPKA